MRLMFDSTAAGDIPLTATIVAGYVDGLYQWSRADWDRFPHAIHVPIACFATTNAGTVLDVEKGCSLPAQAPSWVAMRRTAGVDPTVYVNGSNWNLTRAAFIQQGVAEPHYWLANYDGIAEIPSGAVAKQYANSAISGGHYDLSAVSDYWPGVDPFNPNATAGTEALVLQGGLEMMTLEERRAWVFDGFVVLFGRNPNSEDELMAIVNVVKEDRSNLYDVRVSMWNDPRAATHRVAIAFAPLVHTHKVSGTAS